MEIDSGDDDVQVKIPKSSLKQPTPKTPKDAQPTIHRTPKAVQKARESGVSSSDTFANLLINVHLY